MTSLADSDIEDLVEEITPGPGLYLFSRRFDRVIEGGTIRVWVFKADCMTKACMQLMDSLFDECIVPLRLADEPVSYVNKNFLCTYLPETVRFDSSSGFNKASM